MSREEEEEEGGGKGFAYVAFSVFDSYVSRRTFVRLVYEKEKKEEAWITHFKFIRWQLYSSE